MNRRQTHQEEMVPDSTETTKFETSSLPLSKLSGNGSNEKELSDHRRREDLEGAQEVWTTGILKGVFKEQRDELFH